MADPGKLTGHTPIHTDLKTEGMIWKRTQKASKHRSWQPEDDDDFAKDISDMMVLWQRETLGELAHNMDEVQSRTAKRHDSEEEEALSSVRREVKQLRKLWNEARGLDHRKRVSRLLWKHYKLVKRIAGEPHPSAQYGDGALGPLE